jgi:hypothetical protein
MDVPHPIREDTDSHWPDALRWTAKHLIRRTSPRSRRLSLGGPIRRRFLALRKRRCQVPGLHPSGASRRAFPGRSWLNIRAEDGPPGSWPCVELCGRQYVQERRDWRVADEVQTMNKRRRPVAICTRCGAIYSVEGINQRCGRTVNGERCGGAISSALNKDTDWEECPTCGATGDKGRVICAQCSGSGWLFVRDMPKRPANGV